MRTQQLALVLCAAVTFAAAVPATPTWAQDATPIKIGFLADLTGPFADVGKDMVEGTRLALRKLDNKIAGRPVELNIQDSAGNPDTGLSKARLLVEQSKVDLLAGVYHGGVAMSVAFYAKQQKFPLVITAGGGASPVMNEVKPQPYVFRASHSIRAMHVALGYYASAVLGRRKAVSMAWDYVAGRDGAEGFKAGFEAGGGQVIKQIFFKLGTPDFSPYFTSIPSDADVVQMFVTGADAVRFIKQYAELGYKVKFPLVADALGVSDRLLPEIGDAAVGIVSNQTYMADAPTPGNREFVEAYVKDTGTKPGIEAAYSYAGMLWIARAIESVGGNVRDRAGLLKALHSTTMPQSIRGPMSFNATDDVIFTVNITRVVKVGNALKHEVLRTYDKIDTNWSPRK